MTNEELVRYMNQVLGPLSGVLGWETDEGYELPLMRTLTAYGVDDAEEASELPRLMAYADRELWRTVVESTVGFYNLRSPDGQQWSREQVHNHARQMMTDAQERIDVLDHTHVIRRATVVRSPDPYRREAEGTA